jgi:hypothetical protein
VPRSSLSRCYGTPRVAPSDPTALYALAGIAIVILVIVAPRARRRVAQLRALAADGVVVRARRVSEEWRYDASGYKHRTATYHYLLRREERTFQQRSDFNSRALRMLVEPSSGLTYAIGPAAPRMYSAYLNVEALRWLLRIGGLVAAGYLGFGMGRPNVEALWVALVALVFAIALIDVILDRILARLDDAAEEPS